MDNYGYMHIKNLKIGLWEFKATDTELYLYNNDKLIETWTVPNETFNAVDAFLNYTGNETENPVMGGTTGTEILHCICSANIENGKIVVRSNGVPNYTPKVGSIIIEGSWNDELSSSTDGNPNSIGEQNYTFYIPIIDVTLKPNDNYYTTGLGPIGVACNGVPIFNPWHNMSNTYLSKSRDAMTFATFSSCCGHPSGPAPGMSGPGSYHYHKFPTCVSGNKGLSPTLNIIEEEDMADVLDANLFKMGANGHSPIIGYMLDGYPIYGPLGTKEVVLKTDTPIKIMKSSYIDNGSSYSYLEGHGDLDICNGIYSATPEYPNGCYHYVTTIAANNDGTVKRTINPMYIYKNDSKPIITPTYPYTTIYTKGNLSL